MVWKHTWVMLVVLHFDSSSWTCSWGREQLFRTDPSKKPHSFAKGGYLGTQGWCALQGDQTPFLGLGALPGLRVWLYWIGYLWMLSAHKTSSREIYRMDVEEDSHTGFCLCGWIHMLLFSMCLCMPCPVYCHILGGLRLLPVSSQQKFHPQAKMPFSKKLL